jgi:hypothetical protein
MNRKPRGSIPHYTYRRSKDASEKVVFKRIVIVVVATLILVTVVWFWGTSFINLLGLLAKPEEPTQTQPVFNLPISKPSLDPLPESTNSKKINIKGRTSGGQEVTMESSADVLKTTSESNGSFSFDGVALKKGLNLIKVYVFDSSGEKLEESLVITFDNTPPSLEISQPKNGQTFESKTKKIKIVGSTEADAEVFINDLQAIVSPNGQFTFNYPAKKGVLSIEIKATDKAGNEKKVTITVTVSD